MSRLYVGRLPRDVRERDLERLFKGYGQIRDICLRPGFGFIEFREKRDAEDVMHDFNNREFMGERLLIEPARMDRRRERDGRDGRDGRRDERDGRRDDRDGRDGRRGMAGPQRTPFRILVENLSSSVSWQDLKDFARRAGEVSFADAHKLRPGEGIVEFVDESGLRNALRKLDGEDLRGRRVAIREDAGRGGGGRSFSRRSRSRSYSPRRERSPVRRSYRSPSPGRRGSRSPQRRMSRSRSPRSLSPRSARDSMPPPPPGRSSRSQSPASARSPVSARSPSSHDMVGEPDPASGGDEPMGNNDNWAIPSRSSSFLSSRLSVLGTPLSTARRSTNSVGSSLYGAGSGEEKIVLDIGTHTVRAGFSGDSQPLYQGALFGSYSKRGQMGLLEGATTGIDVTSVDDATLDVLVLEQLRQVFSEHLLADARARKVAVCEGALLPVRVKRAVARVLLGNLRVPLVTFYPSAVTALMTSGKACGLVVDCGHRGAAVVPVFDGRVMSACIASSPMGGAVLAGYIQGLVRRHGRFRHFGSDSDECVDGVLTLPIVEFIMRKLLFAAPQTLEDVARAEDEWPWVRLAVDTPNGRGELRVPQWLRCRTYELLLEGDSGRDYAGIISALMECIIRVPVDLRRVLVARVAVVGGVADMPGFSKQLIYELNMRLQREERWLALAKCVSLAEEPTAGAVFRPSDRPWIGASLAVAAKIGGVDVRRDDFDGYNVPDWTSSY
ncbi:hypothetical protein IW147_001736 [Coemansia sp. RSA 720]|nr:hypothetical protein IW147_001736 [Coemansia sp. RSA 720]